MSRLIDTAFTRGDEGRYVFRHPVDLRPHTVGRTGPAWARWSTPPSDRPCPGRPCLLGFAWTEVDGMATHPRDQNPRRRRHATAIPEGPGSAPGLSLSRRPGDSFMPRAVRRAGT